METLSEDHTPLSMAPTTQLDNRSPTNNQLPPTNHNNSMSTPANHTLLPNQVEQSVNKSNFQTTESEPLLILDNMKVNHTLSKRDKEREERSVEMLDHPLSRRSPEDKLTW